MGPEPGDLSGAIVVGAGTGQRFGNVEKAFYPVFGRPLLCWAVEVFERAQEIDRVCLVLAAGSVERGRALAWDCGWKKVTDVVPGGRERQDSVRAGLKALPGCALMLVHDAARPLVSVAMIRAGLQAARRHGAAIAAIPVRDTLKRVDETSALVQGTVDRTGLWSAQTPQVFQAGILQAAFAAAGDQAGAYTDDAAIVEAAGYPVTVFPGELENIKLTLPGDVALVEALLRTRHAGTVR